MATLSYSFHISNGKNAVSNSGKLARVSKHNLRGYANGSELGYDQGEVEILVGGDDISADVRQAYHEEFDEALQEYNKGKRTDRQIKDYFEKVSTDSQKELAVEVILQVGDRDYWESRKVNGQFTYDDTERMKYVFSQQIKTLQEKCPDFKVVSAVVHYDESSPHMHLVGIPIGRNYKRGLSKQVAKSKVFTPESLRELQDTMRQAVLIQMRQAGYEVELQTKQQGRNKDYEKGALQGLNKAIKEKQHTLAEVTEATGKAQISAVQLQRELSQLQSDILKGQSRLTDTSQKLSEAQIRLDKAVDEFQQAKETSEGLNRQIKASREFRDTLLTEVTNCQETIESLRSEIQDQEGSLNSLRKEVVNLQAEKEGALAIIQKSSELQAMFEDLLDIYNEQQVQEAKEKADDVYYEIKDSMLPDETKAYKEEDIGALQHFFDTRGADKAMPSAARNILVAAQGYETPKDSRSGWFWATFKEMIDRLRDYFTQKNKLTLKELVASYRENKQAEIERSSHDWIR